VPRNRVDLSHDDKRSALLGAATAALLADGYERATMAAIARLAGVTANTLYWYFSSKDELYAAVIDTWLDGVLTDAGMPADAIGATTAVVDVLRAGGPLLAALHERAAHSDAVADVHDALHDRLATLVAAALLRVGVEPAGAVARAAGYVVLVEGVLAHDWIDGLDEAVLDAAVGLA
jgi:AcrR family transcriptional regulator